MATSATKHMKKSTLVVTTSAGLNIQNPVAANTFADAIENAIRTSADPLAAIKTIETINWCGFPLITSNPASITVEKYYKALKPIWGNNIWVNTCSNNQAKKKLLDKISDMLGLGWTVVVI